jgi:hypothetical protein
VGSDAAEKTSPDSCRLAGTRPVSRRTAWAVAVAALAIAALGLFTRLGHYPFWGDEADTVIFARSVWETGDTSAWYGDNLYAYRNGTLLSGLKNRSTPPAGYYLAAPIWGLARDDRFAMRIPFAVCGWLTIGLVLYWAYRSGVSTTAFALSALALATSVALLLYSRQCRYYALGILLTVVTAWLYETYDGSLRRRIQLVVALFLLAATHYLNFAAAAVALVVDYAVFRRRTLRLSSREWAEIVVPSAVLLAALVYVYNPLGKNTAPIDVVNPEVPTGVIGQKLTLLRWALRDIAFNEFAPAVLLVLAPVVALCKRNRPSLRLAVACMAFIVATTAATPQPAAISDSFDVRYLAPLIVPCLVLAVSTATDLAGRRPCLAAALLVTATALNVRHLPWTAAAWKPVQASFVEELLRPRRVGTEVLAEWLNEHAEPGETVCLVPNEWLAPQIVAAPHLTYGWQLYDPQPPTDYVGLPRILFEGEEAVDWIVALGFGNLPDGYVPDRIRNLLLPALAERGFHYEERAVLDTHFNDHTRPELHWHWFRDEPYDKTKRQIYIFRRVR